MSFVPKSLNHSARLYSHFQAPLDLPALFTIFFGFIRHQKTHSLFHPRSTYQLLFTLLGSSHSLSQAVTTLLKLYQPTLASCTFVGFTQLPRSVHSFRFHSLLKVSFTLLSSIHSPEPHATSQLYLLFRASFFPKVSFSLPDPAEPPSSIHTFRL